MIGEHETRGVVQEAIHHADSDFAEAVLWVKDVNVTRFANSTVHQNMAEHAFELTVRVAVGRNVGIAVTNTVSRESIKKAVETACCVARFQEDSPGSLPSPRNRTAPAVDGYVARTAQCSPEQRAETVGIICRRALEDGLSAAGAFITSSYELAVANTNGLSAYYASTVADLHTVVVGEDSSGYASQVSTDVADIDATTIAEEAVLKANRGRNPTQLEPGSYEVILEEYAVADVLRYFGLLAFRAPSVHEGTSFLTGKFGQQVLGENITIWDDGLDRTGLPVPFDFEGVPKQRVTFIEAGTARGVVHDTASAAKEKLQSTGHALPVTMTHTPGPFPLNMFMAGGTATKEDMIKSTRKGIWITRFHYTAIVDAKAMVLTGLTRDGTFLIENGRVTRPLQNLRFTQSCLKAFSDVKMLTSTKTLQRTKLYRDFLTVSQVPTLKIGRFTFTSLAGHRL